MLVIDKHSGLLDPFTLWKIWSILNTQGLYSQHFICFVTYELAEKARKVHYTELEMLVRDKHSGLLDPFVSCEEIEVLWIPSQGHIHNTNFFHNLQLGPLS
jgi:hypothetical protein